MNKQFMENRNSTGHNQIMSKLRKNQDFLMNTQVTNKPAIWTKWHQERLLNQELTKNETMLSNKRYIGIIEEIIQPQFQPKLFKWAQTISDAHKKGLNVLKTVVDLKGQKRFKKQKGAEQDIKIDMDVDFTDSNVNAKAIFRKMMTTTSYCKTFGEKPKAEEDYNILSNKRFSDIQIS